MSQALSPRGAPPRTGAAFPARPVLRVAAACLLLLPLLACGGGGDGGGEPVLRYDELMVERTGDPAPDLNGAACDDRVRWSWILRDGHRLRLRGELGEDPRLVVVYCRPGGGRGELRLRASAGPALAGGTVEERREIAGAPEWQRWETGLAPLAGEEVDLALEVELPRDVLVVVSDAYVRHRSTDDAGWSGPEVWVEAEDGREVLAAASAPDRDPAPHGGDPAPTVGPGAQEGELAGRQILLISVDTLRWDALTARPRGRPLMPRVLELAAEGEVFSPHYAGGSWTKPSHATLLTGHPLSVHNADGEENSLDPGVPTLAGRLGEAGLATAAVVHDCVWLNPKFGFHRGFDHYRSIKGGTAPASRHAVNWIAAHRDRPFFFFLHTFDVHSDFHQLPYEADATSTETVEERFGVSGYGCREEECASGLLAAINQKQVQPLPGEELILRYLYAAGVEELDVELGRLFRDLRELGVWDDLTIVLTSDHGEMLLEHGVTLHGMTWEQVLRVPLVVKWPRGERAGRRTEVPTGAEDVAPTLLELAGADHRGLPGVDLRRPREERAVFSGSFSWWAVMEGGWKGLFFTNGARRLYHLAEDPGETRNLAAERPEELAHLEARLDEMLAWSEATGKRLSPAGGEAESPLTEEERERLRALGYLR